MTDTKKPQFAFIGKYIISADIELKTGLHIGGTEEGFEIGGIDNPVIKDKVTGVPYIPGSSLKGKMRSLLEWAHNKVKIECIKEKEGETERTVGWKGSLCVDPNEHIGIVFGVPAEKHQTSVLVGPTRLTVRDALPDKAQITKWETAMGDKIYTDAKTENFIDRLTSAATPRSMERVPAGSVFQVQFIYDVYQKEDREHLKLLFEGMRLLEDSYLGGGGTRGSGQVAFKITNVEAKDKSAYIGEGTALLKVNPSGHTTADAVCKNFDTIFPAF
jgi:CRISPR-associated protein Csm3